MDYEATQNQIYNLVSRLERRPRMLVDTLSKIYELLELEDALWQDLGRVNQTELAKEVKNRIERDGN